MLCGFYISGLNPKALLFFLAPAAVHVSQLGLATVTATDRARRYHTVNCGLVYLVVGHSARAVFGSSPSAARIVGQTSGVVMIILALISTGKSAFRS